MSKALDSSFIEDLLSKPQTVSTGRSKVNYLSVESRTHTVWFTLNTALTVCSNANCPDARELRTAEGNAMCAVVDGVTMCRVCFLDGMGVDNS